MANRPDQRGDEELRQTQVSFDGLARVDGSARFSFGDTTALASLSGPIEVRLAAELPSKATFEVTIRPLANVPATESKAMAAILRSTLEPSLILTKNPRSLLQLVVQSLSPARPHVWTTTLAAAMINASTLAFLISSSVPMCGIVTAVAVARNHQGHLIADPTDAELEKSTATGCFAFVSLNGDDRSNCVWASWKSVTAKYGETEVLEARELASHKAKEVRKIIRATIAKFRLPEETVENS